MAESSYGTHPEYLPRSVQDAVGRVDGVVLLEHAESRRVDDLSLNRFPLKSTSSISWNSIHDLETTEVETEAQAADALRALLVNRATPGGSVVLLVNNMVVPSVRMPLSFALDHLADLVDELPTFWFFHEESDFFIECDVAGYLRCGTPPSADEAAAAPLWATAG